MRLPTAGTIALTVALLCRSAASARVGIDVERPSLMPTGAEQLVYLEVYATGLDDTNEQLTTFQLALDAPTFSQTGVRFAPLGDPASLTPVDHPYVFGGIPGGELQNRGSTYNRIQLVAALPDSADAVDVTARNGLARVPLIIPAEIPFGLFSIVLSPADTQLAGSNGPITVVLGPPGGINYVPEPAAAGLAAVCGAALLRRRCR